MNLSIQTMLNRCRSFTTLICLLCLLIAPATHLHATDTHSSSIADITFVGSAKRIPDAIELVPAQTFQGGGIWITNKQDVSNSFDVAFSVEIVNAGFTSTFEPPGADGFALVIQDSSLTALGVNAGDLGYAGIPRSIAIEFDNWPNNDTGCDGVASCNRNDPNDSHVSIHTRGLEPNSADEIFSIARADISTRIADGGVRRIRINYQSNQLSVYLDNMSTPILTSTIDISTTIGSTTGWIGITAGTGASYASHKVSSLSINNSPIFSFSKIYLPITRR